MCGIANILAFSTLGDGATFLAMKGLHALCVPGHLAATLSLWAGAALVRSAAWQQQAGRLLNAGESVLLLMKSEAACLVLIPRSAPCLHHGTDQHVVFSGWQACSTCLAAQLP